MSMDVYKVEYLMVINAKDEFCKSIASFNNFLQSHEKIKILSTAITFDGTSFSYNVQFDEILENSQRFFHVRFSCDTPSNLETFKAMLRAVRGLLSKASGKPPEVLWDDISGHLAKEAYPIVHELENLMRKLITKFMFIKIGLGWTKDAVPKEVSDSIKTKQGAGASNYLYEVDFIQLSNFLFKEYSTANSRKLVEKLGAAERIEQLELSELQELVPRSNWERYFAPIVDCKLEYLQPRWERLYILRCLIAHNNLVTESDYKEILTLSSEVKDKLTRALDGLDRIQVSTEQKEEVAENIASELNSTFANFIFSWNHVAEQLSHLCHLTGDNPTFINLHKRTGSAHSYAALLADRGLISNDQLLTLKNLESIRNRVVHRSTSENVGIDLEYYLAEMTEVRSLLSALIERLANQE